MMRALAGYLYNVPTYTFIVIVTITEQDLHTFYAIIC